MTSINTTYPKMEYSGPVSIWMSPETTDAQAQYRHNTQPNNCHQCGWHVSVIEDIPDDAVAHNCVGHHGPTDRHFSTAPVADGPAGLIQWGISWTQISKNKRGTRARAAITTANGRKRRSLTLNHPAGADTRLELPNLITLDGRQKRERAIAAILLNSALG